MTVKSVNTRNLTKAELDKEDARIKERTGSALREFVESLDEDQMGFSGRKEGV